ncbi:MAG: hypothetical protein KDG50_06925 [Chromatiales bacterium]|nr:hypothetical protein [Chromatiales bacterium]
MTPFASIYEQRGGECLLCQSRQEGCNPIEAAEAVSRLYEALQQYGEGVDVCCCGAPMEGHPDPLDSGHTPVSMADYHQHCASQEIDRLKGIIGEVHSWIVCAPISTAHDMMGNATRIIEITSPTYKGHAE